MRAIKGLYKKRGIVELLEPIEVPEYVEVLVIFPHETKKEQNSIYNRLKAKLEEDYPNLRNRTLQKKKEDFERISKKIAENLPFKSWEEMDKALKGDPYGLRGH